MAPLLTTSNETTPLWPAFGVTVNRNSVGLPATTLTLIALWTASAGGATAVAKAVIATHAPRYFNISASSFFVDSSPHPYPGRTTNGVTWMRSEFPGGVPAARTGPAPCQAEPDVQ